MGRIRTVKPELAQHEELFELELELGLPVRFAWAMLPTICDREGRFKWRPRTLKVNVLPYDDCDFSRVLDAWLTRGMLVKYRVGNEWYGAIPTWHKHQHINNRETSSEIPSIEEADEIENPGNHDVKDACLTREPRVPDAPSGEGKGKEGKGKEGERANARFAPPSVDEVSDYCRKKNLTSVDPPTFVDFYQSKNWMVGKSKMKDWQAACRGWHARNNQSENSGVSVGGVI